ncbi:terminase large subunit [Caproicibacterium sp. BJN0003]|uniref:terminase large subunit n=1 Tax=Caproicibacterium sp. BJN0003 TaxID=2994078 RepID=UPI003A4C5583
MLDGKILACEKIKREYENILNDLACPNKYHFDEERANRPIEFIESFCKQSQGKLGSSLKLELFQKSMLQVAYGFVDDNDLRRYQEILDIVGRKNGKTTLLSTIALYMNLADGEGSPECYFIATARDQAAKGFNECWNMIRQSPLLRKHIKKRISDLYCHENLGFIKALASNTNSLDGLNGYCIIIDELAAIKNRDIYDLMKQSMSARSQPMLWCITTNGFVRNGIFDSQYDYASKVISGQIKDSEHFLPLIYELDKQEEWLDPKCWIKANPGIGTIKKRQFLSDCVNKAKNDLDFRPTVFVKDFNLIANQSSAWLKWEELNNEEKFSEKEKFRYCIGGFDGADSIDLNAAKAICKKRGDNKLYIKQMYWIPQRKLDDMKNRVSQDDAPYDIWASQGLLRVVEGNKVNKRVILDWFLELRDKEDIYPLYIGYDPWHIDDSLKLLFQQEFGKTTMVEVIQGTKTLSQPMKDLKAEFQAHNIIYNNNPIDKYCLANTYAKTDINNNIQPDKGANHTHRIDGTAALLDSYVVYLNKQEEFDSLI